MGCFYNCNNNINDPTLITENEKEIEFPVYSSKNDKYLEFLEKDINFLKNITLVEFINLLSYYNNETINKSFDGPYKINFTCKDKFLSEEINKELFKIFLEKIFLKNRQLGEEETTFIEMCVELFNSLELKLKEYYKDKNRKITKRNLLCFGTLFCKTNNISKIKFLFNIFKDDNEQIMKSEQFNEFLMCTFLISSYCIINTTKILSQINPMIPVLSFADLEILVQNSQLEDCHNLLKYFNDNFFLRRPFTWEQFKQKFEGNNGFGWILSTNGIRQKLEEKDISKPVYFLNQMFNKKENKSFQQN